MRIVFAGTPEFARIVLHGLLNAPEHHVVAVYTQPDRPAGRGRKVQPSPVKTLATQAGIPIEQPHELTSANTAATLASYHPEIMAVAAYGLLLPKHILTTPALGCINVHASLLPRWRGAAPIQRAIEAGDNETGVCIMQMDAGLDTGFVFATHRTPIEAADTAQDVHDRLATRGTEILLTTLEQIENATAIAQPQALDGITYAKRLTKAEAQINWHLNAHVLDRQIRAFNPTPIAFSYLAGQRIRIWAAQPVLGSPVTEEPGTILSVSHAGIEVAAGEGTQLRLTQIQRPGGTVLPIATLASGNTFRKGERFT